MESKRQRQSQRLLLGCCMVKMTRNRIFIMSQRMLAVLAMAAVMIWMMVKGLVLVPSAPAYSFW